jgi:ribosomal protein S7
MTSRGFRGTTAKGDGEQKELIKKLVNFRMIDGKRMRVRAIVYKI